MANFSAGHANTTATINGLKNTNAQQAVTIAQQQQQLMMMQQQYAANAYNPPPQYAATTQANNNYQNNNNNGGWTGQDRTVMGRRRGRAISTNVRDLRADPMDNPATMET